MDHSKNNENETHKVSSLRSEEKPNIPLLFIEDKGFCCVMCNEAILLSEKVISCSNDCGRMQHYSCLEFKNELNCENNSEILWKCFECITNSPNLVDNILTDSNMETGVENESKDEENNLVEPLNTLDTTKGTVFEGIDCLSDHCNTPLQDENKYSQTVFEANSIENTEILNCNQTQNEASNINDNLIENNEKTNNFYSKEIKSPEVDVSCCIEENNDKGSENLRENELEDLSHIKIEPFDLSNESNNLEEIDSNTQPSHIKLVTNFQNRKPKLFDNLGFCYLMRNRNGYGSTWGCETKNCSALIKESGNEFKIILAHGHITNVNNYKGIKANEQILVNCIKPVEVETNSSKGAVAETGSSNAVLQKTKRELLVNKCQLKRANDLQGTFNRLTCSAKNKLLQVNSSYVVIQEGKEPAILMDNYLGFTYKLYKTTERTKLWVCRKSATLRKCKASVKQVGNHYICSTIKHNHPSNIKEVALNKRKFFQQKEDIGKTESRKTKSLPKSASVESFPQPKSNSDGKKRQRESSGNAKNTHCPSNNPQKSLVKEEYSELSEKDSESITKVFLFMDAIGIPLTNKIMSDTFTDYLNSENVDAFPNNRPERSWIMQFVGERIDDFEGKYIENSCYNELLSISSVKVKTFFVDLMCLLKKYNIEIENLLHKRNSHRIFNCDGIDFMVKPIPKKSKNTKTSVQLAQNMNVLLCVSANGVALKPTIVNEGNMIPNYETEEDLKPFETFFSEDGQITHQIFCMWLSKTFCQHLIESKIPRPVILFLNGTNNYVTYSSLKFAYENGIILYHIPPYTARSCQPMSIHLMKLVKKKYQKIAEENFNCNLVPCKLFPKYFMKAFKSLDVSNFAIKGFQVTGICPLNKKMISDSKKRLMKNRQCLGKDTETQGIFKDNLGNMKFLEFSKLRIDKNQNLRSQQNTGEGNNSSDTKSLKRSAIKKTRSSLLPVNVKSEDTSETLEHVDLVLKDDPHGPGNYFQVEKQEDGTSEVVSGDFDGSFVSKDAAVDIYNKENSPSRKRKDSVCQTNVGTTNDASQFKKRKLSDGADNLDSQLSCTNHSVEKINANSLEPNSIDYCSQNLSFNDASFFKKVQNLKSPVKDSTEIDQNEVNLQSSTNIDSPPEDGISQLEQNDSETKNNDVSAASSANCCSPEQNSVVDSIYSEKLDSESNCVSTGFLSRNTESSQKSTNQKLQDFVEPNHEDFLLLNKKSSDVEPLKSNIQAQDSILDQSSNGLECFSPSGCNSMEFKKRISTDSLSNSSSEETTFSKNALPHRHAVDMNTWTSNSKLNFYDTSESYTNFARKSPQKIKNASPVEIISVELNKKSTEVVIERDILDLELNSVIKKESQSPKNYRKKNVLGHSCADSVKTVFSSVPNSSDQNHNSDSELHKVNETNEDLEETQFDSTRNYSKGNIEERDSFTLGGDQYAIREPSSNNNKIEIGNKGSITNDTSSKCCGTNSSLSSNDKQNIDIASFRAGYKLALKNVEKIFNAVIDPCILRVFEGKLNTGQEFPDSSFLVWQGLQKLKKVPDLLASLE